MSKKRRSLCLYRPIKIVENNVEFTSSLKTSYFKNLNITVFSFEFCQLNKEKYHYFFKKISISFIQDDIFYFLFTKQAKSQVVLNLLYSFLYTSLV